eukprot:COSAG01_NODE_373_length_17991_cov_284.890075_26_plen_111_part_00
MRCAPYNTWYATLGAHIGLAALPTAPERNCWHVLRRADLGFVTAARAAQDHGAAEADGAQVTPCMHLMMRRTDGEAAVLIMEFLFLRVHWAAVMSVDPQMPAVWTPTVTQ